MAAPRAPLSAAPAEAGGPVQRLAAGASTGEFLAFLAGIGGRVATAGPEALVDRGRNLLTRHAVGGRQVVVKSFGRGRWWRPGGHKAALSFDHAGECRRRGIGSPEPLAAVAGDGGHPWRDHYVCAWAGGTVTAWAVLDGTVDDPPRRRRELAGFLAAMHAAGVDHRDLSPGNVLIAADGGHQLVDTNRMAFHPGPVPLPAVIAALARLDRDGLLLDAYAAASGRDAAGLRRRFLARSRWERLTRLGKDLTRPLRRRFGA